MITQPINVEEKTITKMFCIPLIALRKARQDIKIPLEEKDIIFTFSHYAKIIYNIEKFQEWFENNKWVVHIDFNAEIRRDMILMGYKSIKDLNPSKIAYRYLL